MASKAKRSVSFKSGDSTTTDENGQSPKTFGRSSFKPGRQQGYVRRGPVQSDDSESGEDDIEEEEEESGDEESEDEESERHLPTNSNGSLQPFSHVPTNAGVRPGQNYMRKSPVASDSESDAEGDGESSKTPTSQSRAASGTSKGHSDTEGSDKEDGPEGLVRPFAQTRIGQNYVRKAPATSDTESDEEDVAPKDGHNQKPVSGTTHVALPTVTATADHAQGSSPSLISQAASPAIPTTTIGSSPMAPVQNAFYAPGSGIMTMGLTNPGVDNSANVVSSLAIYQQQQQEMMMIMQQQQIQIATMQQQQQAYQLLVLQQQQQHQQQLQAIQLQHSLNLQPNGLAKSPNAEVEHGDDDDDDDDVPLGDRKQRLPKQSHGSIQSVDLLGQSLPQHSQQMLGAVPLHMSANPSYPGLQQYHSTIATQPSMLEAHQVHAPLQQQQQQYLHEDEYLWRLQEQHYAGIGEAEREANLLTSGFPAGYAYNMGSMSSIHSVDSGHTEGMKPSSSRNSLIPQQTLLQSIAMQPQNHASSSHHTLIHVEAKPPPPQTGLVGAISAMEREKKWAKAHGTNQLQYQHQQQQQQQMMMMNAEKERWVQEQRHLVWETEQAPHRQVHQAQQPASVNQSSPFSLPGIPSMPLWSVQDDDDDNRPLGSTK